MKKCQELLNKKHIIFHQDNAKLHVCLMTRQNCYNLAGKFWFIQCIHYIAPSDVHLFQFLQTSLTGKNINSLEDCKSHLKQFFVQKGKFGEDGIMYEVAWKMAESSGTKACASSSPAFLMIYSAYKLNKQGDNIHPWHTFSYLEPVCCSMSTSNCCFLTCIKVSQEAGQEVCYSHLFQNFPQFIVFHTIKGFGIVNKAEIDIFLELSCFFDNPSDVGNLISGPSAFSKASLNIW